MSLSREDGLLFYQLYPALLCYANQKLKLVDNIPTDIVRYLDAPGEDRLKVRNALQAHKELIDEFVRDNPTNLLPDELAVVSSWKNAVAGSFFIFRYLQKHTIFLNDGTPPMAYGVIAVADPIQDLSPLPLPILTQAVLLPFKGKIIYDGLLSSYRMTFGPGVRRRLNDTYKQAKEINGLVTSLP